MKAIDLFSCIGCHAIGFQRAGIETECFVELNPFRQEILAKNFPKIPIHEDVKTFHPKTRTDIVIGGPPCQQTSCAAAIHGNRTGRSLWSAMARVARECRARWIVVEQPPGNSQWEGKVTADLRAHGMAVSRAVFSARDFGAPYLRRRVFIIACASLPRLAFAWAAIPSQIAAVARAANARSNWRAYQLESIRVDVGASSRMDRAASRIRRERIEALGDSNPPEMAEVIGRAIRLAEEYI